jgi:hypothetical protein
MYMFCSIALTSSETDSSRMSGASTTEGHRSRPLMRLAPSATVAQNPVTSLSRTATGGLEEGAMFFSVMASTSAWMTLSMTKGTKAPDDVLPSPWDSAPSRRSPMPPQLLASVVDAMHTMSES